MIIDGLKQFKNKHVLLLQGPVGPFFWRLAKDLKRIGAHVHKINFNGGDLVFYPKNASNYNGNLTNWPQFLSDFINENNIDIVLLFGDSRPFHVIARKIVLAQKLQIGVFEEGYIRPDFVTLEEFGVNGNSAIPLSKKFYENLIINKPSKTQKVFNTFWHMAFWAVIYCFFAVLLSIYFHQYKHHKPLNFWQGFFWIRSFYRKMLHRPFSIYVNNYLISNHSKHFFLVPLQLRIDTQVLVHSNFSSMESFIDEVITSFARNANQNELLVIKLHPLDRGFNDYGAFIQKVAKFCNVSDRIFYVDSVHLPDMLKHAKGVVVINSTVGLSAINYRLPVIALGKSIYNFDGLTFQGDLSNFWKFAEDFHPNNTVIDNFAYFLIRNTQINGSFYKKLTNTKLYCGLRLRKAFKFSNIIEDQGE